jgi:mono/diheme cytochrome c family protein
MSSLGLNGNEPVRAVRELVWDETAKVHRSSTNESKVRFSFTVTNPGGEPVEIETVLASCGCTTTEIPPLPWILGPGETGSIGAVLNIVGKPDFVEKTITVVSSLGVQVLTMQVFLSPPASPNDRRTLNQQMAFADRQAVFRADCARCHVPANVSEQKGEALFEAMCAICHAAPHRAAVVPDLTVVKSGREEAFWVKWIAEGREGSLMPAFAREHGGVLSPEQVHELAAYATKRFAQSPE